MKRQLKSILPAAALLLALSLTALAQVQSTAQVNQNNFEINPLLGAPTVTITSATMVPNQGVLVKWSVVKPTLTQLIDFDITVQVRFENGKSADGSKNNVAGSLREAVVSVPGSTFPVTSIQTTLVTKFHTQSTVSDTRTFTLGQSADATQRPSGSVVELTSVTKLLACAAGKDCFEVRWSTNPNKPSLVSINSFSLKLEVGYANGQQVSGTASASGSQTQAVIAVTPPANTTATTATATITAGITIAGLVTTVK